MVRAQRAPVSVRPHVRKRAGARACELCVCAWERPGPANESVTGEEYISSCGGSLALVARRDVSHRGELGEVTESFADKHAAIKLKVPASMQRAKHQDAHTHTGSEGVEKMSGMGGGVERKFWSCAGTAADAAAVARQARARHGAPQAAGRRRTPA
jgi:hypothetical protein